MAHITENLAEIRSEIARACDHARVPLNQPEIIAVTKRQPLDRIKAALDAGHRIFGENRLEEAEGRWPQLKADYKDVKLHFIGSLQSRKVKKVATLFDVLHTLDRVSLVPKLAAALEGLNKNMPVYIQVNTGEEPQKGGCPLDGLDALITEARSARLNIVGLMCLPPKQDDPALHFALLKKLAARHNLPELSMGMSKDYALAAAFGASCVRIGTGIFGARKS